MNKLYPELSGFFDPDRLYLQFFDLLDCMLLFAKLKRRKVMNNHLKKKLFDVHFARFFVILICVITTYLTDIFFR